MVNLVNQKMLLIFLKSHYSNNHWEQLEKLKILLLLEAEVE